MEFKRNKRVSEKMTKEIQEMKDKGYSIHETAKIFGLSESTVAKHRCKKIVINPTTGQPVSNTLPATNPPTTPTLTEKLSEIQGAYNVFKKYGLL